MFQSLYHQYKVPFWFVLALLFASGAVSNYYNGTIFEVYLNGVLAVISFVIALFLLARKKKE